MSAVVDPSTNVSRARLLTPLHSSILVVSFYLPPSQSITFLYKFVQGIASGSFGANVARLAGVPEPVLALAGARSAVFAQVCEDNGSPLEQQQEGVQRGKQPQPPQLAKASPSTAMTAQQRAKTMRNQALIRRLNAIVKQGTATRSSLVALQQAMRMALR